MQAAARLVDYHNMPGPSLLMALQVHGYFEGIGYELPEKANPADFYMDIVAGVVPNRAGQQQTPQARLLLLVPFSQSPAADPLKYLASLIECVRVFCCRLLPDSATLQRATQGL